MGQVRDAVGRVHHQQVLAFLEPVEVGVVQGAAGLCGDQGVLSLPHVQSGGVVGEDALEERKGPGATQGEPTHVGHVEQAGTAPCGQMFLHHSGRVHDGHVPAGELHHLGAQCSVVLV